VGATGEAFPGLPRPSSGAQRARRLRRCTPRAPRRTGSSSRRCSEPTLRWARTAAHAIAAKGGAALAGDPFVGNAVVSMYEAFELFEDMQGSGVLPDVISWNTLVSGFARDGDLGAVVHLSDQMWN
jgi:pentatricopeptide repeat protein